LEPFDGRLYVVIEGSMEMEMEMEREI